MMEAQAAGQGGAREGVALEERAVKASLRTAAALLHLLLGVPALFALCLDALFLGWTTVNGAATAMVLLWLASLASYGFTVIRCYHALPKAPLGRRFKTASGLLALGVCAVMLHLLFEERGALAARTAWMSLLFYFLFAYLGLLFAKLLGRREIILWFCASLAGLLGWVALIAVNVCALLRYDWWQEHAHVASGLLAGTGLNVLLALLTPTGVLCLAVALILFAEGSRLHLYLRLGGELPWQRLLRNFPVLCAGVLALFAIGFTLWTDAQLKRREAELLSAVEARLHGTELLAGPEGQEAQRAFCEALWKAQEAILEKNGHPFLSKDALFGAFRWFPAELDDALQGRLAEAEERMAKSDYAKLLEAGPNDNWNDEVYFHAAFHCCWRGNVRLARKEYGEALRELSAFPALFRRGLEGLSGGLMGRTSRLALATLYASETMVILERLPAQELLRNAPQIQEGTAQMLALLREDAGEEREIAYEYQWMRDVHRRIEGSRDVPGPTYGELSPLLPFFRMAVQADRIAVLRCLQGVSRWSEVPEVGPEGLAPVCDFYFQRVRNFFLETRREKQTCLQALRILTALLCFRAQSPEGALPEQLSALVPKWLPELPENPLAPGSPWRFEAKSGRVVCWRLTQGEVSSCPGECLSVFSSSGTDAQAWAKCLLQADPSSDTTSSPTTK